MNEFEYAARFLTDYKVKGDEIVPRFCPFCGGGSHHDKETFALNAANHTFNCKRGSCGISGHFSELLKQVGEKFEDRLSGMSGTSKPRAPKKYKKPETPTVPLTDAAKEYCRKRGFTDGTLDAFGVKCGEDGVLVFPYYMTAEDFAANSPVYNKFRLPKKITSGTKMWRETDTMPTLFGLHLCDPSRGVLYITEGEFDAMAVWQMAEGSVNVVSVPSGAEDFTWLETCGEALTEYRTIAVIGDSDAPGVKMADDLVKKIMLLDASKKLLIPDYSKYLGCKDMNEFMVRHGSAEFAAVLSGMQHPPVHGLLNIADIRRVRLDQIGKTRTGIPRIDSKTGGFLDGDLTVWSGKRGEGKSTFLNQVVLQAVEDGKNVCVYSGEIPEDRIREDLMVCAAGPWHTETLTDTFTGTEFQSATDEAAEYIDAWWNHRLWVYDNKIVEEDERSAIIERFSAAYSQYDCRVFVVDNLMIVNCNTSGRDVMQAQADFVIKLRKFAQTYGVHVHIVVHPRKTDIVDDADDVGGLGAITNVACNVYNVRRGTGQDEGKTFIGILKCRLKGMRGEVDLLYNEKGKRFGELYREPVKFGWQERYDMDHAGNSPEDKKGMTA